MGKVPLACGSGTKGIRTPDLLHAIYGPAAPSRLITADEL
jgi:hypothetical protein